jgi:hypothetical protein
MPSPGNPAGTSTSPSTDPLSHLARGRIGPFGPLTAALGVVGVLWVSLGIALVVVGIFLLVAASFVVIVANSVGSPCSMNLICTTSPDLHIGLLVAGIGLLLTGIASGAYGLHRSLNRSTWLTMPP